MNRAFFTIFSIIIAICAANSAQASKTAKIVQNRIDRIERSEQQVEERLERETEVWPDNKIEANLMRQVPIVSMLGFLAAEQGVDSRLEKVQTVANQVRAELADIQIKRGLFVGLDVPSSVRKQTRELRSQVYEVIEKEYGTATLQSVRNYLKKQDGNRDRPYFLLGKADY